jgi:hypothetical protein
VAARAEEARRHGQLYRIAKWTLLIAIIAAVAGLIAAWPVVEPWLVR